MNRLKVSFVSLLILTFISGCQPKSEEPAATVNGYVDSSFQKLSDEFITSYLAHSPAMAVALGFHEYDGKVQDYSKAGIEQELSLLKSYEQKISAVDSSKLSARNYADQRMLLSNIRSDMFRIEDQKEYTQNPMTYAGAVDLNIYIKRNFAPIESRIKSIIAIEEKVPSIFEAARANLEDSLAKPFVQLAITIAKGSADFLAKDMLKALKDVKNDTLMAAFNKSNKKAVDELNGFACWLEKEKLPKSHNNYALGKAKYQKMLWANEGITLSPEKILEIGLAELKKEQDVFNHAAKIINPKKKPIDVYLDLEKEHPVADSLIPEARKHVESIRQFLIDKKIVTMPSEVRVKIEETPPYARSTSSASMDTPGPFEERATEAYYYITPVDNTWTAKQKEDWLQTFNYYTTDVVSIHEAYPGHYTQFLHLNASPISKVGKIFGSYAFVEGWAHYTEKMMLDEGFGNNGDSVRAAKYRMAQAGDALLRLCRLCVSIKTHTEGMTVDEGTKFLMDNWYQGDKPSRLEALRGTYDPGYLYYTLGKLQILKLKEDYKRQEGNNFSLMKFHDQVLDNGMPSIYLLRQLLLKDKSKWGEIL